MNHYRSIAAGYIDGLNQAMAKGEIRPIDADTVAYALMGMGEFLGLRWILWEQQSVQEEKLQSLMDFIYYGIAPRG